MLAFIWFQACEGYILIQIYLICTFMSTNASVYNSQTEHLQIKIIKSNNFFEYFENKI